MKEKGEGEGGKERGEEWSILLVAHTHTYTLAMYTKRAHSAYENMVILQLL